MGRPTKRPPEILTAAEVRRLLAATGRGPTAIRNRALIVVFYRSALRCAEALALRLTDVNLDRGTIRVLHGKGDRARTVAMDAASIEYVRRWVLARTKLEEIHRLSPLFCTLAGKPVQPSYVRQLLPRLARVAGIDKRVSAHNLRHTLAAELDRERVPLSVIQTLLGHADPHATSHYLRALEPREVVDVMRRRTSSLGDPDTPGRRARSR
jgi:site-specific recombinase XerD